ncbi:nectin-4-like isoform X2 [Betta splendens]|uniref:Nectin-4-like isoform X2 n=1 Tax=Betta splendens TaxID=158456 RepID=A0A6P7KZV1_BETSP|nr:nectin-4-like isoform X2 [Betta splendens]
MESEMKCVRLLFVFVLSAVCVRGTFVEPLQPETSQRSLAESQTRLPCRYRVEEGEKVVQVSWYKELPDGSKDQIITAHFEDGHTEFGRYSGRVKFESGSPTDDSALLIPSTEVSDEGVYACHISTFPNGNFERRITLTVWILPISSVELVTLEEGQTFRVVASCRAVGRPLPSLTWDTELPGQSQDRVNEGVSVSSYYSLHPLRGMNGKKLDCLVWHPGLKEPRRIPNRLEVQYPPDATIISTPSGDFHVGLEKVELACNSGGHPKPPNVTWTWRGGALPDGVSVVGEKLLFGRPIRMNDSGVYECVVKNSVGVGKSDFTLTVTEPDPRLLIIIGASAAAVVLILVVVVLLVNRHHRRKNKRLQRELSEKDQELSLSRQASFRRLNSVSSDPRVLGDDYALLRVDSRIKHSQMSLERNIYRGSQSTLGGKWAHAGVVEVDELGRPVVWHEDVESMRGEELDREREERKKRSESYMKSSNMSLIFHTTEGHLKPDFLCVFQDSGLPSSLMKAQQDEAVGSREQDEVHQRKEDSPPAEDWDPTQTAEDRHEADDCSNSSYQISEALTNHFYLRNGLLRPKPHSNAILLHPKSQLI